MIGRDIIAAQREEIEARVQAILDARDSFPDSCLADHYHPLTRPPELTKAHQAPDRAVDRLHRRKPFASDTERLALLFE